MAGEAFASPGSDLVAAPTAVAVPAVPVAPQPTGGQGLALDPTGHLSASLIKGYPNNTTTFLRGDGSWAAPANTFGFISEIDLSTTTSFTTIPATFRHLKIFAVLRSSRAATVTDSAFIAFNADSGANYDYAFVQGNNGAVAAANGVAQTSMECAAIPAASATASMFAIVEITIPYYALTTNMKAFQSVNFVDTNESAATLFNEVMGGTWRNTAAITSVSLTPNTGVAWVSGSKASLYGIS